MSVVNIIFSATVILAMVLLMHLFVRMQNAPQMKAAPAPSVAVSDNMVNELMASLDAFDNGLARNKLSGDEDSRTGAVEETYTFTPLSIRTF